MDNPKVSVLIPMYNRKHYIEQCIDSALNQTFKENYEIIVRDDSSTDGSYEFVKKRYSKQISKGKIKLRRNKKNIGEFSTDAILLKEAYGKYVMLLHSDDMYLPHALQHLYEVAEKTNADVVHASFFLNSPPSGIINDVKDCKVTCWEKNTSDKLVTVPNDPMMRFNEWINAGTFIDAQYNIFNREFILENNISFSGFGNRYMALWWIMLANVLVKTPVVHYVRRDSSDSKTNTRDFPAEKIEKFIENSIEMARLMDRNFSKIDFFKENKHMQYIAKAHLNIFLDNYDITRRKVYADGITPELYYAVERSFKKIFGENYFYPMFLFNCMHVMPFGQRVDNIIPAPPPPRQKCCNDAIYRYCGLSLAA